MDAKDIEIVKSIIEAAIKAAFETQSLGMVPFSWVALIVGGLVSGIGVTWAWGLRKDKATNEQLKAANEKQAKWTEKVEELSNNQRDRDDAREEEIRKRYDTVIAKLNADHAIAIGKWEEREKRLEASKELANQQNQQLLRETGEILGRKLEKATQGDLEVVEFLEKILPHLERLEPTQE